MKNAKCLICDSHKLKKLKGYYEKHELVRCENCKLTFMENIPNEELLAKHYSNYSYNSEGYYSPLTKNSYNRLLDEFEKYRKTNKILDVGCGRGWFLIEAKKRGWNVYGTEFSDTAVEICESNGISIKKGAIKSDSFTNSEFDIITSFEVIEHINNPNEQIQLFNKFLRKGGLLYLTTPNFNCYLRFLLKSDYSVIEYPEHLIYFTRSTLNRLLTKNNFSRLRILTTGASFTRFNTSKNKGKTKLVANNTADERVRQFIDGKWYMEVIKYSTNILLNITSLGMSLKSYHIKK